MLCYDIRKIAWSFCAFLCCIRNGLGAGFYMDVTGMLICLPCVQAWEESENIPSSTYFLFKNATLRILEQLRIHLNFT